jgi:hypothetical protein
MGAGEGVSGGQGAGTGAAGGTGAPPVGTGGGQGAGGSGGTGGTPPAWYAGYTGDLPSYLEAKGFKDQNALAESYRNLEKLKGVPEDRLLQIPDKPDSPDWDKVHAKLGRPEKADGYEFSGIDGKESEFAKWAGDTFHKAGLSKAAGESVVKAWNDRVQQAMDKEASDWDASVQQQQTKLKQEWGAAFDQKAEAIRQFSQAVGLDDKTAQGLAKVMGVDGLNKFLDGVITKFGIKMGEQSFHGTGGGGNNFGVLSPGAAREKIGMLQQDSGWMAKWRSGDAGAQQEWERLHQWAYPSQG